MESTSGDDSDIEMVENSKETLSTNNDDDNDVIVEGVIRNGVNIGVGPSAATTKQKTNQMNGKSSAPIASSSSSGSPTSSSASSRASSIKSLNGVGANATIKTAVNGTAAAPPKANKSNEKVQPEVIEIVDE